MFRMTKLVVAVAVVLAMSASSAMAQGYRDTANACGSGACCIMPAMSGIERMQGTPGMQSMAGMDMAQRGGTVRRSYSFEPAMGMRSYMPARSYYSSPMMRGSRMPSYLLPNTDPRKHRG